MITREWLKRLWFGLLGKDPRAVVVVLRCGPPVLARGIEDTMRSLLPDQEILIVEDQGGSTGEVWLRLRRRLEGRRIALIAAPVCGGALFRAACLSAPRRILAFHANLDRFHLRWSEWVSSLLFLRGVPLDRIALRPRWLVPWRPHPSNLPQEWRSAGGRGFRAGRPRVAVVSPYLPLPASHGGAVRIWNLLRQCSDEFDIAFFGFEDGQSPQDLADAAAHCAALFVASKPRYREPRWSTLLPPEVHEFHNSQLSAALRREMARLEVGLLQAEYTQMGAYRPDVLVEHDITKDLMQQVRLREGGLRAWWDWIRWKRLEDRALARATRVIVMSEKDRVLAGNIEAACVPNGVDLVRFAPAGEPAEPRLLFVGSFRHFPNVQAWGFFLQQVWPLVCERLPGLEVDVVAGPNPELYWQGRSDDPRIRLHGFVADVAPLYRGSSLVIVPTVVSAGTNLKALEAMAAGRALVATSSGVAGLGLRHLESAWISDDAQGLARGIVDLTLQPELRARLADAARQRAVAEFGWPALAEKQAQVWRELLPAGAAIQIRPMSAADLEVVGRIQRAQPLAAQWAPADYLEQRTVVAETEGRLAGFLAARAVSAEELEILNVAIDPSLARRGAGSRLLRHALLGPERSVFLEVRESNLAARALYARHGFAIAGRRKSYYRDPQEDGIVMNLQKW